MKILVTGGSGFIGSEVMEALIGRGFDAVNFDMAPPRREQGRRHRWIAGDLLDTARLRAAFDTVRPDAVIHLAARADLRSSAWEDFASIHEGTANLLAGIDACPEVKKLVNISTQLVIGPTHMPTNPLDFHPVAAYGAAKAHAERLLLEWRTPIHWLTIRPANIWGPGHPHFPNGLWKHIRRRTYLHPAGKPVVRGYGYVHNSAEQIVALLLHDPKITDRGIFYSADAAIDSAIWADAFSNALTGRPARRAPVALLKTMGLAGDVLRIAGGRPPLDSTRVSRMTRSYCVPVAPTLALTGAPLVSMEDGVAETVAWLTR